MKRFTDAIFIDFGTILAPKTLPKIVQKSSKIALLSHFGRSPELRRLQGTNLDVSGSIRDQFWRDFRSESHSRARFSAVPPAESCSRARFGHFSASKSALKRARAGAILTSEKGGKLCASEKPNFEELTLMIRATRSRSIDR